MKTTSPDPVTDRRVIKRVKSVVLNREIDMDFTDVNYVVGTRSPITPWSAERRCALCDHPVYTSMHYPEEVRILCEQCFASLPGDDS